MTATEKEKNLFGCAVQIVSRTEDQIVYKLEDPTGPVLMTCYQVFPGIALIYNEVHARRCFVEDTPQGDFIEINHCREGRIEFEFHDEFLYLSQGDISVNKKEESPHESYFPLSHYHGISVMIDLEKAPLCMSSFLEGVNVRPRDLGEIFCKDSPCFVARATKTLENIFSELYNVPEQMRKALFKIKVLDLMLYLCNTNLSENETCKRSVKKSRVTLAKNICNYLTEHMDSHVTISELAEIFHVSQTALKNSFKDVYGVSVYTFIRTQKMQAAARLLRQTDCTVLEIAGKYGYDNGSKFAYAFKNVMGMAPNEYRNAQYEDFSLGMI